MGPISSAANFELVSIQQWAAQASIGDVSCVSVFVLFCFGLVLFGLFVSFFLSFFLHSC